MGQNKISAVYIRVSTEQQNINMQEHDIDEYIKRSNFTLFDKYIDQGISGSKEDRPELSRLMSDARLKKFDVLIVWKLDRLGRSVKQIVNNVEELKQLGIDFISLRDSFDTGTPQGKFFFHIISAFAELEREIIKERVKAGLEDAKRRGKKLGRPEKKANIELLISLRQSGLSLRQIAEKTKISYGTVYNLLKKPK